MSRRLSHLLTAAVLGACALGAVQMLAPDNGGDSSGTATLERPTRQLPAPETTALGKSLDDLAPKLAAVYKASLGTGTSPNPNFHICDNLRNAFGRTANQRNTRTVKDFFLVLWETQPELGTALIAVADDLLSHKHRADFKRSFSESKAMTSAAAYTFNRLLTALNAVIFTHTQPPTA